MVCKQRLSLDFSRVGDAVRCGNVMNTQGGLRSGCGVEQLNYPYYAKKVVAEYQGALYVWSKDALYRHNDTETKVILGYEFDKLCGVIFHNKFFFSGPPYYVFTVADGVTTTYLNKFGAISMTACGDRLFAVNGDGELLITTIGQMDWSKVFTITTNDKPSVLVAIGTKAYALGDTCYALTHNTAEDIDVTYRSICQGVGQVQGDTQAVFGRKAVFATDSGLRLFQSENVTPIFDELNDFVNFEGSVGCAHKGLYYLSARRRDTQSEHNDVTLVLDVHKGKIVEILDMGWENLYSTGKILYATAGGKLYKFHGEAQNCYWLTTVDFGNSSLKFLDTFLIRCKRDAVVTIKSEFSEISYNVNGGNVIRRLPVAGSGRKFTVKIHAQNGLSVDYAEITARRYEV